MQGSIFYFGRSSVNEVDKTITTHVGSTPSRIRLVPSATHLHHQWGVDSIPQPLAHPSVRELFASSISAPNRCFWLNRERSIYVKTRELFGLILALVDVLPLIPTKARARHRVRESPSRTYLER